MNFGENKKTYYVILAAGLIIFSAFLYFGFGQEESIKNYPSNGVHIIAFGDSLVQGTGASSENKNFVSILSQKTGTPIINLGVPGDTTSQGLARINELDKYNPKIVLLLLGGNDFLRKVPIEETFGNLEKIIQNIQERGAIVLVLGVRGGILNDKFESQFENIKDKYETAYVPNVLSGLIANEKYMSDAVHPNDAGYQIIADKVYPVLLKLIR